MKENGRKLLDKAARSIKAAERLLQGGDAEFAVSRAKPAADSWNIRPTLAKTRSLSA